MTFKRCQLYPPVKAADLVFGVNSMIYHSTAVLDAAADLGAKVYRFHTSWDNIENYSTGVLTLPAATVTLLEGLATRSILPMMVTGYGPCRTLLGSFTAAAAAAVGSTSITVNESVAAIDPPFCHINKSDFVQFTAYNMYCGAFIRSVNTGTKTITFAAPSIVAVAAGETVRVNRLRYASVTSTDPTEASTVAFARYLKFVAQEMDRLCGGGYVNIWNEAPWNPDSWADRNRLYDGYGSNATTIADGIPTSAGQSTCKGLIAAVAADTLPASVKVINGGSDVTGGGGAKVQNAITAGQAPGKVFADGFHPYGFSPEAHCWYPHEIDALPNFGGSGYNQIVDPVDQGSNFSFMARQNELGAPNLQMAATEFGTDIATDTAHSRYVVRSYLALWSMGIRVTLAYTLADTSNFRLISTDGLTKRPAFYALKRMLAALPTGAGNRPAPAVLGWSAAPWDLMTCRVTGGSGSTVFAWQRTTSPHVYYAWEAIAAPAAATLTLGMGTRVVDATNLITGVAVSYTVTGNRLAIQVSDEPIAIRFI